LPGSAAAGDTLVTSITMYDAAGNSHSMKFTFTCVTPGTQWTMGVDVDGTAVGGPTTLNFDATGALQPPSSIALAAPWGNVDIDLAGVTNYGGANTVAALSQDGSAMGELASFSIGADGTLMGVFTNGRKQALGQIALAAFDNPPGLMKAGGSMFRASVNSGNPNIGAATSGPRGMIVGASLEMSNVDLALEFTNLIIAQRGFQANSRVITSSDEILQDLVNLKR
jgi:flagellar hook protein FlgE